MLKITVNDFEFKPSFRSQFVTKRSYCRPLNEDGTIFETREEMIDRTIGHQRWLWETAKGKKVGLARCPLTQEEEAELQELKFLMMNGLASLAGRTLWLGGTEISKRFQSTQFNCSFERVTTVHDVVDLFHLLLLGSGVGFEPVMGILNGFAKPVDIEVIRSTRKDRGFETNKEEIYTRDDGKLVWHLTIGDSGVAWAKAAGKILAMKKPVDVVVLDFSEIRPGGKPLRGFGWISSGDEQIHEAFHAIAKILSNKSDQLLTRIDNLDIMNWLGTSLSSRRSAEIALMPSDDPEAEEFAVAKKDHWLKGQKQRSQSNNSLVFYHKPTKRELRGIFSQMLDAGGSEPGFINGMVAKERAPWFVGVNPCLVGDSKVRVRINGQEQIMRMKDVVDIFSDSESIEIMSWDETTNKKVWKRIKNAFLTKKDAKLVRVTDTNSGKSLVCTPDHKIFTTNRGWVEAQELSSEDSLVIF